MNIIKLPNGGDFTMNRSTEIWADGNRDPYEPDFEGSAPSEKEAEKLAFAEGYELRMPWKGTDEYSEWVMTEGVEVPETEGDGE